MKLYRTLALFILCLTGLMTNSAVAQTRVQHSGDAMGSIVSGDIQTTRTTAQKTSGFSPITQLRARYTSRPLLAVGELLEIDTDQRSIRVLIDRERSVIPNALDVNARKVGTLDEVLDNEFPTSRTFVLSLRTLIKDARPGKQQQPLAVDGKVDDDSRNLKLTDFHVGDHVSVLYRMSSSPEKPARVLTFCQVDPKQKKYYLDHNPFAPRRNVFAGETDEPEKRTRRVLEALTADKVTTETIRGGVRQMIPIQ